MTQINLQLETTKKVLSIDGGGIRGIIAAYQLVKLEEKLGGKVCDYFDLIAGTSTGSILAAGLSAGFSAQNLLDLYLQEGPEIFSSSKTRKLYSWAKGSKYKDSKMRDKLFEYFGDMRIKDLNTDFLAVTYNMSQDRPRFFSTSQEGNFKVIDVIHASSAAPTYFNPKEINGLSYIDGGMVSNNPAMCAYAEASSIYKKSTEGVFILSLGNGTYVDEYKNMRKWWKFQWINPLIEIMLGADSGVVDFILKKLYSSVDRSNNYHRITGVLPKWAKLKMDNTKPKSLKILLDIAEDIFDKNEYKLNEVVSIIK